METDTMTPKVSRMRMGVQFGVCLGPPSRGSTLWHVVGTHMVRVPIRIYVAH